MININILNCEFVRLTALYAARKLWGIDCEDVFCNLMELYNYIKMVTNITTCEIPSTVWEDILACQNRIIAGNHNTQCNTC